MKVKTDTVLKNFWRDNERFADLFNAAFFDGKKVIRPEELEESDTDLSGVLKFGGYGESVQKIMDVVKKRRDGTDFAILGLENQQRVHLGMPLRIMLGDAFGYLKEYQSIAKGNRADRRGGSSAEFLSGFRKGNRLHPIVTLCVYYGENLWDGPITLADMMEIPAKFRPLVNDYRMHLIQVRESEDLHFHNPDVRTVFEVSRDIYNKNYDKLQNIYQEETLDPELGLVIGAITESKELINHALEKKGGSMNMCKALEELKQEGAREKLKQIIRKKLAKGRTVKEIADALEENENVIQELIGEIQKEATI